MHSRWMWRSTCSALALASSAVGFGACSDDSSPAVASSDEPDGQAVDSTSSDAQSSPSDASAIVDAGCGDACVDSTLPAQVLAAGYTMTTLSTSTFTTSNLDLDETHAGSFTWFPWNVFSETDKSAIALNSDGTLLLKGATSGPNAEISTIARKSGGGFVGIAFGGGGYFEAIFSFDPATVVDAGFKGWPSWWSLPVDGLTNAPGAWWNGDASGNYHNSVEQDFFEYDLSGKPLSWGATMHDWYGVQNVTCDHYCDWHTPTSANIRTEPVGTDFTKPHSIGYLWIPATATTKGSRMSFFDRVAIGEDFQWDKWTNAAEPDGQVPQTPQPPWAISWVDEDHYFLILGTGVGEPMTVKSASVWQASAADNQHF